MTKPVPANQLDRDAVVQPSARPMSKPRSDPKLDRAIPAPQTISFRLDAETSRVLASRAAMLGCSPHLLAKQYVELALQESIERGQIAMTLLQLERLLRGVRDDLASTAVALLVKSGDVSEEDARTWVDENFARL